MELRKAAVAGHWYPGDPDRLAHEVDRHLAAVAGDDREHAPRAIVAPHAGLMYSGPVAAYAYHAAQRAAPVTIVLVGPSHFVPFRGVSIWPSGHWQTPFGAIAVDTDLAHAIRMECFDVVDLPSAHGREHSLEMQLPFVAHLQPGARIVPLVMGHQTRETAFALGDGIARAIRAANASNDSNDSNDSNVLLIASSDLSHYETAEVASRMDAIMVEHVEAL